MVANQQLSSPRSVPATEPDRPPPVVAGLKWGEIGFLGLLVLALVCVFLSGRFAYREAALFQQAKDNGVALLHWATAVAAASDGQPSLSPKVCQQPDAPFEAQSEVVPLTWAQCREQLWAEQGPMVGLRNPFGAKAPLWMGACERGHYAGRGALVVEKGTASPPGFPPTVSYATLGDEEALAKGTMLRVVVCDPSGYGVRVGEVKL